MHRPRRWDAISLVELEAPTGDSVSFVALPDGSYVVEGGDEPYHPAELARSLELPPPYRAEAVRRGASTWAVGASAIVVVELPGFPIGEELEVVWDGVERATRVDGVPTLASVAELAAHASARYDAWVVRAHRLRDSWWEVEAGPL
jgi:hypothetical protein